MLSSAFDLLLVILGFSLIIVVHELGHFIAARWAGIRVLAFAVGFGPALFSYRKGLGFRPGSSEGEFRSMVEAGKTAEVNGPISPTEYRLNVLPLGGYVKMLGQDDADPTAMSDAPDSYQTCPPPKRMIVISAGVVMNLLLAALLFCIVFMIGLKTEPARIGDVTPGSPAATAAVVADPGTQSVGPGLKPGDQILAINGESVDTFNDVSVKVMMAKGGSDLNFLVRRPGVKDELQFRVAPRESKQTRTLEVGIGPMLSTTLGGATDGRDIPPEVRAEFDRYMARAGLAGQGLEPGDRLLEVNGEPVTTVYDLRAAAAASDGTPPPPPPLAAVFQSADGTRKEVTIATTPELQESVATVADDRLVQLRHLLGLLPVLTVETTTKEGEKAGLLPGDVFARLGDVEYPSVFTGISQIRAHAKGSIEVVVLRRGSASAGEGEGGGGEHGEWAEVNLGAVPVSSDGTIGFGAGDTSGLGSWVTVWPGGGLATEQAEGVHPVAPLAGGWLPGTRIVRVNDREVATLADVREELKRLVAASGSAAGESGTNRPTRTVTLGYVVPIAGKGADSGAPVRTREVALDDDAVKVLNGLTWEPKLPLELFSLETVVLKEPNPIAGIGRGIERTHNVMIMTYLTFVRLFQGTVKVEHVKGPVGIAHIGTLLAGKGFVWLLFFLALISVNLAVINFLPIPITDGGHFLFLLYEQLSGKPPPVAVQNAAALVGFVLLGGVFLFVLVNDIMNLAR